MDAPDARPEFSRGATFEDLIEIVEIEGVSIPFLKPELLIKTKETVRPKDLVDKAYLQELIERGKEPEQKKPWWRW